MKLREIAARLQIACEDEREIRGLNTLKDAKGDEISFLENKKYLKDLSLTRAGAVFVTSDMVSSLPEGVTPLVTPNPYISLAYASEFFAPAVCEDEGKSPVVGEGSHIMGGAFLGKNVTIGRNCRLMPNVYVGDNVTIGDNVTLHPNVVIYRDCTIGNDVRIHSGTVVGSDGFGFANEKGKYIKIYQNGNVTIGNDVEIGANCTIDRAAFNSTIIEDGVRLDNLIQIAHNCIIGKGSIITSQVGLSGSTILREYVVMAGQSASAGHLEIAPFTTIMARGGVTKNITEKNKQWSGFPAMEHRKWLRLQGKIAKLVE
jgi:UDP-3-O-[3-hydroxymyristoyl] glucosamine N-acyltransferase